MNNKLKILILVLLTTIVSGCTANYNVKINLDGSVKESAELTDEKDKILSDFTKKNFEKYVEEYINLNELENKLDKYTINITAVAGVDINNKYENIYEYVNKSPAIEFVFKKVKIREKGSTIKLRSVATGYDLVYRDNDGVLNYTNSTISISLPYEVTKSNADSIDEEKNIYTWNFDEEFDGIEIDYNQDKYYTNNFIKLMQYATVTNYFTIIVLALAVIIIIIILFLGIRLLIRERNV